MADGNDNLFPGAFKVQWNETVHMMDLCANQIDLTLSESNDSFDLLTNAFTTMAGRLDDIEKSLETLANTPRNSTESELLNTCYAAKEQINAAIIGLQFYDRLTQRLQHVREALVVLAELIDDPNRQNTPEEWISLRNRIKSNFSKEQQKTIFHALMKGADIDEVFELFE